MKIRNMATFSATLLTASALLISPSYAEGVATPKAAESSAPTTQATGAKPLSKADLEVLAKGLRDGKAPRESHEADGITYTTYKLSGKDVKFNLTFPYHKDGSVAKEALGRPAPGEVSTRVSAGMDKLGPYVDLDSAEQASGAVGLAGTITSTLCAALGPETVGIGCLAAGGLAATVVGILTTHGACPDNKTLRIYPASNAPVKALCK